MASFKETCEEYFGTSDFYEVLGIERTATEKEIKRAYHRLSLLVHPDRVDESKKAVATEKFKVLGRIHSVLTDKDKRKSYDDCGEIDDSDSSFDWMDYWGSIFKKIEIQDIEDYKKIYIGSEKELADIKRAYVRGKGNMDIIHEFVHFVSCDSEPRILEIVRKMVDDGEVEEYPGFFTESKAKKARRRRKWENEKKEVQKIDMKALQEKLEINKQKRLKQFCDMLSRAEAEYGESSKRKQLSELASGTKSSPAKKKRTGKAKK